MKKLNYIALIMCTACLFTCSSDTNDNDGNDGGSGITFPDVTIIGEASDEVLQTDFTEVTDESETEVEFNLSTDLGLIPDYDYLNLDGDLISFFEVFPGVEVYQKNLFTQNFYVATDFCDMDFYEVELLATNSSDRIIIVTLEPNDQLNVRIFNPSTGDCIKIPAGVGFQGLCCISATVYNNSVYMAHRINNGDKRIARISLSTLQLEEEITFTQEAVATFRNNEMLVFLFDGNYNSYDPQSFDLISENGPFGTINYLNFSPGLFKSQFQGDKILIDYGYAQPSLIDKGPALLNLNSGELEEGSDGFLFTVSSGLADRYQTSIGIGPYAVDLSSGLIVVGFANYATSPPSGGVVYTNFNSDLNKIIQTSYVPNKVIIR
ncbi:MAG: hypothetical protein HKO90_03010 [Flavobacteriaceae bacterium]|nr:hypothetical protein [Bacteroidia bacterium]NNK87227.1 hypothetical protein [Flavobacteriaceae bacterium]